MGRNRTVNKSVEESFSSENGLANGNLHEMETQVIGLDDEETGGSPPSKDDSPSMASTPQLEGRRTRSGKSLGVESVKPKREKSIKTKTSRVKGIKRVLKSSLPVRGIKNTQKTTEKNPEDEVDSSGKSEKSTENENRDQRSSKKDCDKNEVNVPLADFMANLNVSPSAITAADRAVSSECNPSIEQEPGKSSTECPENTKTSLENEATSAGKLKSLVADSEGLVLARSYRRTLRETEEFALNYISQEFHHPVITCFRELTKSDISLIVGSNKLKKSCNSLEQSVVYLGLIDLLATINNNPVYGESETTKITKSVSSIVQKILLEFKNIMGTWALSSNEQLSNRYTLILNYLRTLAPMFKKAGFDTELNNILDCIEKEVSRHKQNQEKIKAMSGTPRGTENSTEKKVTTTESHDGESRSALNEIILNVDLNVKLDDSDDEDLSVLKEEKALKIFGKPLKGSPRSTDLSKKKSRKPKGTLDFRNSESFKSPNAIQQKQSNEKSNTPKSHTAPNNRTTLPQPKTLSKVFQSSDAPKKSTNKAENNTGKTPTVKRSANEDLNDKNDTKKRKMEEGNAKVQGIEAKSSIKSFFQSVLSSNPSSSTPSLLVNTDEPKPQVNAFALMMNRSREIAQKKKTDKLNALSVPSLKVDAVKS